MHIYIYICIRYYKDNVDIAEKRKVCIENYNLTMSILWKIFETKHDRLQGSLLHLIILSSLSLLLLNNEIYEKK